ncbi:type II restriction endonuclease [Arthrobacter sp. zg-Y844]|uniref:type II restriction endonuclease n=1 Tax=Arthrobacter sp. zg-Y844 TaxID=2964612 RepID=UPI002105CBD1|nr:type II restriction endonuclease [Arthrobacter sp. zg-Y844]MCQ1987530.1 type II restriction endonuclease [Arthrobacter sp. zg-Y844]
MGDYFKGFAVKVLADVDVNKLSSNQHEFNGSRAFRELLGTPHGKKYLPTRMAYLDDDLEELPELFETFLTWYDARESNAARGPEFRLLYRAEADHIINRAAAGDTLFLAEEENGNLILVIAKKGSTILRQLQWVFDVQHTDDVLFVATDMGMQAPREEIASEELLALLGIDVDLTDDGLLDSILRRFGEKLWPSTPEFSAYARSVVKHADPVRDPDGTLMQWVGMEHRMFRTLEKYRISESIADGFLDAEGVVDVEGFLKLSLSVHNRRKARAGLSLEEHISTILKTNDISFVKKTKTEGKKEPDFLFPSKAAYGDLGFPSQFLTMLGSKTSLKDRWRQVLNEANRIPQKHLLTLQPAISEDQTAEMQAENLRLVIPRALHGAGFTPAQQGWLLGLDDFILEVRAREIAGTHLEQAVLA